MPTVAQLSTRATLQSVTRTRDATGGVVEAWAAVATVWAEVAQLSGRELERARQVAAEVTTRVTLRSRSGVSADSRFAVGSRTLRVVSAVDDGRFIECLCAEAG